MTTATLVLGNNINNFPKVNWKGICILGAFLTVAVLIFYAWQINQMANFDFLSYKYKAEINSLLEENKNLKITLEENNFSEIVIAKIKELNFQKVSSVRYIQVLGENSKTALKK